MIEITYLDASKQERTMTFESYEEFERSQHACLIGVADYYPVQKVTYKEHDLDYHGTYGDVFFYLMKQDLSQYNKKGEILWQKQLQMQHLNKKLKTDWSW